MAKSFPCNHCGSEIVVKFVRDSEPALCRSCGKVTPVPTGADQVEDSRAPTSRPPTPPVADGRNTCPGCHAPTPIQARTCPACGYHLPRSFRAQTMSATGVLGQTFELLGAHFVTLFGITLAVYSPWILHQLYVISIGGAGALLDENAPFTVHDAIYSYLPMILDPLATAAAVFAVFQALRGRDVVLSECLQKGLARMFRVLLVGLVTGILIGLGSLALLIPGLILALMFYVAIPSAVVEKLGVGGAISRSTQLTKNRRLSVLGLVILLVILGLIPAGIVAVALSVASATPAVLLLVTSLGSLLVTMISMTAATVAYHDLRVDKEGIDTNSLASVFD